LVKLLSNSSSDLGRKSIPPDTSWIDIEEFYTSPDQVSKFNNAEIMYQGAHVTSKAAVILKQSAVGVDTCNK